MIPISLIVSSSFVLSFGRCKFRLSERFVSFALQSILGGHAASFCVVQLAGHVFRFSLPSQDVGFHIYKLRSFECLEFKIFFHLWHNGGPSYQSEYRNWKAEQAKEWVDVVKGSSRPLNDPKVLLTVANSVPIHSSRISSLHQVHRSPRNFVPSSSRFNSLKSNSLAGPKFQINQQRLIQQHSSVHLNAGLFRSPFQAGLNSPGASMPLGPAFQAHKCLNRNCTGHKLGRCIFAPRSSSRSMIAGSAASPSGNHQSSHPPPCGPPQYTANAHYVSFADYSLRSLGITPPPPIFIP